MDLLIILDIWEGIFGFLGFCLMAILVGFLRAFIIDLFNGKKRH